MPASAATPTITAATARRMLLAGLGLLENPARRATAKAVRGLVRKLGFVQVDSIPIVARAHHHVLMSRLDGYRSGQLTRQLEHERSLFEHWTHDAAAIPIEWFPFWRFRFAVYRRRWHPTRSRLAARLGPDPRRTIRRVRARVRAEGPLRTRDFETREPRKGSFWSWTPEKTALEYLWRVGELAITRRERFEKVYDLVERTFPDAVAESRPTPTAHLDWACGHALGVLGSASPTELVHFFDAVDRASVLRWCARAERRGEIVRVAVAREGDGPAQPAFAHWDWRERAQGLQDPPERLRLLSPFDPLVRDRARAARLFGFEYRFEGFVPKAKRRYGYYVLPILERDRLTGRADARFDRERGELVLDTLYLEPGLRETGTRRRALRQACELLGAQIRASGDS